jgi:hypothetical protein
LTENNAYVSLIKMKETADTELLREFAAEIADPESLKQLADCLDILYRSMHIFWLLNSFLN